MTTALATQDNSTLPVSTGSGHMLFDPVAFAHGQRVANLFASCQLIPAHLRNKPADCFIALHVANRMQEDPLMVMQNMFVVNGTPGWKTQYMIARANSSGKFKGTITWDVEGKEKALRVRAKATLASGESIESPWIDFAMAEAEGWTKNAKYKSMPEMMFRYRSAAFLSRLYAPEVMLGYQTVEELETSNEMKDVTPLAAAEEPPVSKLDKLVSAKAPKEELAEFNAKLDEVLDAPKQEDVDVADQIEGTSLIGSMANYPAYSGNDLKKAAGQVIETLAEFAEADYEAEAERAEAISTFTASVNVNGLLAAMKRKGDSVAGPKKKLEEALLPF